MNNGNMIHLNSTPIDLVGNILTDLNNKIKVVSDNLSADYGSYEEMLQSAKAQINAENKSTAEMTMDEYKDYINNKLQSLIRDATRYQDSETVVISDAGFAAMKADSEYEAWVIETVQKNLSARNYLYGIVKNSASICVHQFGATKEEYRGYSHSAQPRTPLDNTVEDFWTQRHKRSKKLLEMEQEMFDNLYQLKELSNHKAAVKAAQAKANGLVDTSNPMPVITGVPAKYLLSMLTPDSNS